MVAVEKIGVADNMPAVKYKVRIVIKHPTLDLSHMTDLLQLQPSRSWSASDQIRSGKGEVIGGTYGQSMWTCSSSDPDKGIPYSIERMLESLNRCHEEINKIIQSGGSVAILLDMFGDGNTKGLIESRVLRDIGNLGVDLGIEVFPL